MASMINNTTIATLLDVTESTLNSSDVTTVFFEMNNSSKSPVSEVAARTAFLIIITLMSLFGNSIVFITLYRRQYLLTPSNKLVFSLTSANFVFSIVVMPFVIAGSAMEQWYFGSVWCSITGFLTLLVKGASMLLLAGIACDRYYAIVHPMSYPRKITGFRATVVIIVCWVIAAICAVPPLFGGWSKYKFHPQRSGCLPVWQNEIGFTLFWIIVCFFIPYCTMLGCYFSIFKVARKKTRQVNIKVDCTPRHSSEDDLSNSQDSSDSYTDAFPTTRVIDDARDVSRKDSDNVEVDSGINVSGSTHASTIANEHAADHRQRSKDLPKGYSDCTRLYLPNQVECKESPKFASRRRSMGLDNDMMPDEPPVKNMRKSSNASIISSTSQVFRRTSLAFSAVKYYSNQMKAVFTIAFILGILLCTMGPFVIVALVEAFHFREEVVSSKFASPVSQVSLSVSTCFFYLTCVYYPLFYGLWNRTVRKEMRQLLCGKKQDTFPTRVRILSLATHIQDLGMSPGLTAAIISGSDTRGLAGTAPHDRHHRHHHQQRRRSAHNLALREPEPPPVMSNKRRHTLHSLPALSLPQSSNGGSSIGYPFHSRHGALHSWVSRDAFHGRHGIGVIAEESEKETASDTDEATYNSNHMRRWRNGYSFPTVTDLINENEEKEAATRKISKDDSSESMQSKFNTRSKDIHISRCQSMKSRAREKPATSGLLELTSAEVLSNAALSSALLFTGCGTKTTKGFDMYTMTNGQTICRVDDSLPNLPTPEIVVTSGDDNENETILENNVTVNQGNRPEENGISSDEESEATLCNQQNTLHSQDGLFMNFPNSKANVQHSHQKLCDSSNNLTGTNGTDESCRSNSATKMSMSVNQDCSNSDAKGGDAMSLLTGGLLHGSNLIHLEAGEPIAVRQWSQSQFVDFFASSIAYGVVEAGKTVVHGTESEDTGT